MKLRRSMIARAERDDDGFWIYLHDGYADASNTGCHTIVEDTRREAFDHEVERCTCAQCAKTSD